MQDWPEFEQRILQIRSKQQKGEILCLEELQLLCIAQYRQSQTRLEKNYA